MAALGGSPPRRRWIGIARPFARPKALRKRRIVQESPAVVGGRDTDTETEKKKKYVPSIRCLSLFIC
jgi:hypothetical protein